MAAEGDRKSVGYKQKVLGKEQESCDCEELYAAGIITDADIGKVKRTWKGKPMPMSGAQGNRDGGPPRLGKGDDDDASCVDHTLVPCSVQ